MSDAVQKLKDELNAQKYRQQQALANKARGFEMIEEADDVVLETNSIIRTLEHSIRVIEAGDKEKAQVENAVPDNDPPDAPEEINEEPAE